jgi:hypothetical protein
MSTFYSGLRVKYRDHVGVVHFVCEKYITICIQTFEHKSRDVCILVYSNQWNEIQLLKQSEK